MFGLTLDTFSLAPLAVKAAANRLYEKWKKIQQDHHEAVGGASAATSTSTSSKDKNISSKSKESETGKRKSVGSDEGTSSNFFASFSQPQ